MSPFSLSWDQGKQLAEGWVSLKLQQETWNPADRCLVSLEECGGGGTKIQQQRCQEYQSPVILKVDPWNPSQGSALTLIATDKSSVIQLFQSFMLRGPMSLWTQRRRSKSTRIKIVQCVMMMRRAARETMEQVLDVLIRISAINLLLEVKLMLSPSQSSLSLGIYYHRYIPVLVQLS